MANQFSYKYKSAAFSLDAKKLDGELQIIMCCGHTFTTKEFPETAEIIKRYLPNVCKSKCFNPAHLPFSIEMLNTEIGHLFEHILLENLCCEKMNAGFKSASFSGQTKWNTCVDDGIFHINVWPGNFHKYDQILPIALEKSIWLTEKIMNSTYEAVKLNFPIENVERVIN